MKLQLAIILPICLVTIAGHQTYTLAYPDYFPQPVYDFSKNPLNHDGVELGRKLFYDPILSKDNTISCASCHSPYNSFAHTDHDLSHGIDDQIGKRNAPALFNLAWQKTFMWDGAINHLDVQALAPISHAKEMGENISSVVDKLQQRPAYVSQFNKAWGDTIITGELVLKSLSQFQLTLVSTNSKYDKVKRGEDHFNDQEKSGYTLFQKNCNSCHTEPLFSTYAFASNGLPIDTTLSDFGKMMITTKASDSLMFKIPSLRNLSFTYPYMHDGRFKKLSQILKHYNSANLKLSKADVAIESIQLNSNENVDLIAFLLTLNDSEFVFNPKHQFPKEILKSAKD